MSFLKKWFKKEEDDSLTPQEKFWRWFQKNNKSFYKAIDKPDNIEEDFFDKLSPQLDSVKEGFYFLAGKANANTAELILTADGTPKNIYFVEDLVKYAPKMDGWKITALKQPSDINSINIQMDGYKFDKDNIFFYANNHPEYPDEIDITIVHQDFTEDSADIVGNGTYIFIENYLGELDFANIIDNFEIIGPKEATEELIPIYKLKDFLIWRQKEFIEKYEDTSYHISQDDYSILNAILENEKPLIAIINRDLLGWDSKASHPWIAVLTLAYKGGENGLPEAKDFDKINDIEEHLLENMKQKDGVLYVGRQTANNIREIFFACKDFRHPSIVMENIKNLYGTEYTITYDIFKDKYWQSFERFQSV